MIKFRSVFKNYKLNKKTVPVLKDIHLSLNKPGLVYLIGESGSGKSTLLNIIGGLDKIDQGEYFLFGEDTAMLSEKKWAAIRQSRLGIVFQQYNLIDHLTILENVKLSLMLGKYSEKEQIAKAEELLEKVDMWDKRNYFPNQLSGGQKQRVAIARSLANDPEVLLADEPTGALDSENADKVMHLFKEISEQGKLVIIVTHSQDYMELADQVIELADGEIIQGSQADSEPPMQLTKKKLLQKRLSLAAVVKMAFRNINSKKSRTFLTAMGASVGIMSVLLIAFFSLGMNNYIENEFSIYQTNKLLMVNKTGYKLLSEENKEKLSKQPGVKEVITDYVFSASLKSGENVKSMSLYTALDKKNSSLYNKTILKSGQMPTKNAEIVIPEETADQFFGSAEKALGKEIELVTQLVSKSEMMPTSQRKVTISGVTRKKIVDLLNLAYVSHPLAESLVNDSPLTKNQATGMILLFDTTADSEKANKTLKKEGYISVTPDEDTEMGKQYITILFVFLGLVAGISLVVAAIMIAIVIYVSVIERRKEIGILKSIGAARSDIRRLFVTEGAMISLLGGCAGVVLSLVIGVGANHVLKSKLNFTTALLDFNGGTIISMLIFSVILGMIVSFVPARKAAKASIVSVLNNP
ncbi:MULTISPECIES: ATP-binding cassette domain-containing protein [unclassified Enterococcus]|uniref:ABC transporter ATP-binding protein/permease n=1 Tax=unclassified Enterococcus TaxID=2608891 RepID=UPI001CE03D51|nr:MULTISPECIES: ABC transporter ATP-binding protein/permease [unclassified Enterococcus]MCA5013691.1 ATP-binding cassette domain-containing protein [Enterococcus sp. S23]MCA5016941.1 ATP-binding cassette domain-containing protein [Enterococcus sp. S22(2020)]